MNNTPFQPPCQLSFIAACALLTTSALAQTPQTQPDYYFGLGIGASNAVIDEPRISAHLIGQGALSATMDRDERSHAFRVFGGYRLSPNWAIEASYFNLGRFSYLATTVPAGSLQGQARFDGLGLDLVGELPVTERWSVLGRVGAQHVRARDRFAATGFVNVANPTARTSKMLPKVGVGVQYDWSASMRVRLEVEQYRVDDAIGNRGDVRAASLSLVFPFGRTPAPAPAAAPPAAPPTVAQTPAPPPPVAPPPPSPPPPPPPVVLRNLTLSADVLFSFDKAVLRPEGRARLEAFARDLQSLEVETIDVAGHTDRLGPTAHNQRLSQRRAEAVKQYLVELGVDPAKMYTAGFGPTRPAQAPELCVGKQATNKLIACLQPDRRVEIQVVGRQKP